MKDEFTTKVTIIPSCLISEPEENLLSGLKASETFLTPSEGYRRVRRSAAMIGLAISMSASGMVLSHKATATTTTETSQTSLANISTDGEVESTNNSLQAPLPKVTFRGETAQLTPPALKYQVKSGENVWKISRDFKVKPEVITASNQLSDTATLQQGQTLTIPSTQSVQTLTPTIKPLESQPPTVIASKPAIKSLISSSLAVRSQTFKVQPLSTQVSQPNNPVALASPVPTPQTSVAVADVSQPIQVIPAPSSGIEQTLVPAAQRAGVNTANQGIAVSPNSVQVASSGLAVPIPIAVPTPEEKAIAPVRKEVEVPSQSNAPTSSGKLPVSLPLRRSVEETAPQGIEQAATAPTTATSTLKPLDQPVAIAVIASETPIKLPQILETKTPVVSQDSSPERVSVPANPMIIGSNQTKAAPELYQVKAGDTLESIAQEHGLSSKNIIQVNQIRNPNLIQPSQALVIPKTDRTEVLNQAQAPIETQSTIKPLANPSVTVARTIKLPEIRQTSYQPTVMEQAKAIPITVEAAPVIYTEQIKADVARMPQAATKQSQMMAQGTANESIDLADDVNPEWKNSSNPLPRNYVAPRTSLDQLQRNYRPRIKNTGVSNSQIIGAAPSDVQDYNDSIRIPVGQEVSPDLPPLSAPQFPNAPTQFTGYIWPAKGVLTSGFGRRWGRMHKGVDIGAPIGTPVMAAAAGEVIYASFNSGGYGNLVKIRHGDGSITYYGHNSRLLVRPGQTVAQGEQIAEMGSTGRSTGPHLHFEIRPDGASAMNPIAFLPQK